jgi:hypothetical protein
MDTLPSSSTLPDLVGAAAKLEKAAVGWWTVAYTVPTRRQRKVSDGVDDEGKDIGHMETVDGVNTVVRGWREGGAFLAAWSAGKAECAYWWTREHEAWAELPRELVRWTTPHPTPVRVSFRELTRLVKSEV